MPPTRTSSSLPRPDRPVDPPRVIRKHQRHASDGGIIDTQNLVVGQLQQQQQLQHTKTKRLDAYEEVPELLDAHPTTR